MNTKMTVKNYELFIIYKYTTGYSYIDIIITVTHLGC